MNQTVASLLTKSLPLFWVLVFVDKGRDVCTSLDYGTPGQPPTISPNGIPLFSFPFFLGQIHFDFFYNEDKHI